MPVLETSDKIVPRSALRHRPIDPNTTTQIHDKATPATTPAVKRASRRIDTTEVAEWQRADHPGEGSTDKSRTSSIPRQPKAASRTLPRKKLPSFNVTTAQNKYHISPLLYLGIGMIVMIVLWIAINGAVNWTRTTLDDIQYGRPRTFQTDAFVGHNESAHTPSHFIAMNFHGRIEIIEFPGGDATHAHVYLGPQLYGPGSDLIPVTLSFAPVNGDHKNDMIVHVQGSEMIWINTQGGFRPLNPGS